jgi:hypothetical protein
VGLRERDDRERADELMTRVLLLWLLTWAPVFAGADGSALLYPEQVTYSVKYVLRGMVTSPACPLDNGTMQACATPLAAGEWSLGTSTSLPFDAIPEPAVGEVYDVQTPCACNVNGCGCAP